MKKVSLVSMGLGADTLSPEALQAIAEAEVLIGAPRMVELAEALEGVDAAATSGAPKASYPYYLPDEVNACIARENAQNYAVLVSGDVGFYSSAVSLAEVLQHYELRFIPGISSMNAFFARLKLPWHNAAFVSMHGRNANLVDTVRRNRLTFCLTGNNVAALGEALTQAGFGSLEAQVGENLGTSEERITRLSAEQLTEGSYSPLTVMLIKNDAFDASIPCGLPDSSFTRGEGVPMTKSEVRALALSRLRLHPRSQCWDIGAGTGSVSVEMALSAYEGTVFALERKQDALELLKQNCARFHVGNVEAIWGSAPEALDALPAPDAVFIGGSGGHMRQIVAVALEKNPGARLVIASITLETVSEALAALQEAGLEPEIVQISTARGRRAGTLHLMEAQNPITLLSAGGGA